MLSEEVTNLPTIRRKKRLGRPRVWKRGKRLKREEDENKENENTSGALK